MEHVIIPDIEHLDFQIEEVEETKISLKFVSGNNRCHGCGYKLEYVSKSHLPLYFLLDETEAISSFMHGRVDRKLVPVAAPENAIYWNNPNYEAHR